MKLQEAVTPLYDMNDACGVLEHFEGYPYNEVIKLCDGIRIRFTDVGHLLGSASIEVWIEEDDVKKKLIFFGDIGNLNQPLIRDPQFPGDGDYVIMESTYGKRFHNAPPDYAGELASVIQKTFDRGGNLVIPSFAVGRTQELLYFIREIKERGLVHGHDNFDVFVDSPLAVEATTIFNKKFAACLHDEYGYQVDAPYSGSEFDLAEGCWIREAAPVLLEPKKPAAAHADTVFARLLAAGQCLLTVIRHNEGGSNKDLAKFTSQINSLCDKWDR